jgi:hypothetical protein
MNGGELQMAPTGLQNLSGLTRPAQRVCRAGVKRELQSQRCALFLRSREVKANWCMYNSFFRLSAHLSRSK